MVTKDEYDQLIAELDLPYARRQQLAQERERSKMPQSRDLTDAEMARWRAHFHDLVAQERAAMEAHVASERTAEREFIMEVVAVAITSATIEAASAGVPTKVAGVVAARRISGAT
jgi:gluconate kinase